MSITQFKAVLTNELRTDRIASTSGDAAQSIVLNDPTNFATGTTTGVKIGTGATQKFGFFGATPVVQQNVPATGPSVQDIIDALVALGLVEQSD